jgi:hypothetical protein
LFDPGEAAAGNKTLFASFSDDERRSVVFWKYNQKTFIRRAGAA